LQTINQQHITNETKTLRYFPQSLQSPNSTLFICISYVTLVVLNFKNTHVLQYEKNILLRISALTN